MVDKVYDVHSAAPARPWFVQVGLIWTLEQQHDARMRRGRIVHAIVSGDLEVPRTSACSRAISLRVSVGEDE